MVSVPIVLLVLSQIVVSNPAEPQWSVQLKGNWTMLRDWTITPLLSDDGNTIYVGTSAYNSSNGDVLWTSKDMKGGDEGHRFCDNSWNHMGCNTIAVNGILYTRRGALVYSLDERTGNSLDSFDVNDTDIFINEQDATGIDVSADGSVVFLHDRGYHYDVDNLFALMRAVNVKTHVEKWRLDMYDVQDFKVSPGGSQLVVSGFPCEGCDGVLFALDPESGETLWNITTGSELYDQGHISWTPDGVVVAHLEYGFIIGVDSTSGKKTWSVGENGGPLFWPAVHNNMMYYCNSSFISGQKELVAMDVSTTPPKMSWMLETEGCDFWLQSFSRGAFPISSDGGFLLLPGYVIDIQARREVVQFKCDESQSREDDGQYCLSSFSADGLGFYVVNLEQKANTTLSAFDLPILTLV